MTFEGEVDGLGFVRSDRDGLGGCAKLFMPRLKSVSAGRQVL